MHAHVSRGLAAVAAMLVLSVAVSTAEAGRFSVSNQRFRTVWSALAIEQGSPVRCAVTLEGSFHSATLRKTAGALLGYVSRAAALNACTGGNVTVGQEMLPWHIGYRTFRGVLPVISGIEVDVVGLGLRISAGGIECRLATTAANPAVLVFNREPFRNGPLTSVTPTSARIPVGPALCELFVGSTTLSGSGTVTVLEIPFRTVTVTLI